MQLVITVRKDVTDRDEGEALYEKVKQRMQDHPEIKITAHVTNHFVEEPEDPS